MKLDLKLSQKGWILVSVPLLFELIFVGTLALLVWQAENLAEREAHSKEIIARGNDLVEIFYGAARGIAVYLLAGKKNVGDQYEEKSNAYREQFEQLRELVKTNPKQAKEVERLYHLAKRQFQTMDMIKQAIDENGKAAGLIAVSESRNEMESNLTTFITGLRAFVDEEARSMVKPEVETRSKNLVKWWLAAGVIFNIMLAAALAVFFNRGTAQRLGILMDNTRRLASNEILNLPISGGDEIAHLDRTFHEMATELAESRRKERAVIDNAVDVICSVDADGKFAAVNPASKKVLGFAPNELIGRSCSDILHPEDVPGALNQMSEIKSGQPTGTFENRIKRKDGSTVDVAWSCYWSDAESSMFCVIHDVSERKEIERLKQEFVAMISHDLRTPLTALQGTLAILRKGMYGPLNEQGDSRVAAAESNVLRLIKLINELLELEKLEAGKLTMRFGNCKLSSVIQRSLDSVQTFAEQSGVRLESTETPTIVYADEDRLVQVLVNLVSNAVKFSPKESAVTVSADQDGSWVEIKVTDRGRGIPAKFKDSIFDRFKQIEEDDERKKGGTGLGLAICKAIVQGHNGTIGVESEEGKGSTFWFRLPQGKLQQSQSSPTAGQKLA